jgi:hypothetical protein
MAKISDMDPPVIAGYMEELRFAKRQQWAVAGYAIALIAGAFQLMKPPLTTCEKSWVTLAIVGVAAGGIWLVLCDLQSHLASTRTTLDANDPSPLRRGRPIAIALAVAIGGSGVAVIYSLWRSQAYAALPY